MLVREGQLKESNERRWRKYTPLPHKKNEWERCIAGFHLKQCRRKDTRERDGPNYCTRSGSADRDTHRPSCRFRADQRLYSFKFFFFLSFPSVSVQVGALNSHLCVTGLAGQASALQVDGWSGLGPVLGVTLPSAGPVVVDLRTPGVCGDDPRGGSPLFERVRRFNALLDFFARPRAFIGSGQAFPYKDTTKTRQKWSVRSFNKHFLKGKLSL